jgi:hypothetical protein
MNDKISPAYQRRLIADIEKAILTNRHGGFDRLSHRGATLPMVNRALRQAQCPVAISVQVRHSHVLKVYEDLWTGGQSRWLSLSKPPHSLSQPNRLF